MSTISKAILVDDKQPICQGDIFKNVKYNYIESEDDEGVNIVEFEFPYAIIVSQACDVISMDEIVRNKQGKATKFMPAILMCPIYDEKMVMETKHLEDVFSELKISQEKENMFTGDDRKVANKDWHYRFHSLTVSIDNQNLIEKAVIDHKHYFTVSPAYLVNHIENRVFHLGDIFAEQITLKFATYLSRVAIPD